MKKTNVLCLTIALLACYACDPVGGRDVAESDEDIAISQDASLPEDIPATPDYFVAPDILPEPPEPCPEGFARDQLPGSESFGDCIPALPRCGECLFHWQCGQWSQCVQTAASLQFCMPKCVPGECDDWATCERLEDTGLRACMPNDPYCCGPIEHCPRHCEPSCGGETPYCDLETGHCEACLLDEHCPGEFAICEEMTQTCDPCGGLCAEPYPGCALISDVPSCVPCTRDEHCGPGRYCDLDTYTCPSIGPESCTCLIDGCQVNHPFFHLRCDPESGCCYDAEGKCDDAVAFCNTAHNSRCVGIHELWPSGNAGAMFPEGFEGGICNCDAAQSTLCNLLPDNELCEDAILCHPDVSCTPMNPNVLPPLLDPGDFCWDFPLIIMK